MLQETKDREQDFRAENRATSAVPNFKYPLARSNTCCKNAFLRIISLIRITKSVFITIAGRLTY